MELALNNELDTYTHTHTQQDFKGVNSHYRICCNCVEPLYKHIHANFVAQHVHPFTSNQLSLIQAGAIYW